MSRAAAGGGVLEGRFACAIDRDSVQFPLRRVSDSQRVDARGAPRCDARLMSQAEYPSVTAVAKANVYFDGKVVSHTIKLADNSKKTLGLIYPGQFHFGTDAPERMDIIAGSCEVKLD